MSQKHEEQIMMEALTGNDLRKKHHIFVKNGQMYWKREIHTIIGT